MSYLSLSSPRRATPFSGLRGPQLLVTHSPRWQYSNQSDGYVAASYTSISGAAVSVYGLHPQPIRAVFPSCTFVCVSLTPRTTRMRLFRLDSYCVSAIGFSHVTSYLLLDCSLLRLLISLAHFFPSFQKRCFIITRKKQMTHLHPWHPFSASSLFTPLPSLPDPLTRSF
jgi:hypothetical protein